MSAKRALDFSASLFGLILLALPLALIAAVIFLEDRQTPFYRGVRIGLGGSEFRMLKFRTMVPDAAKTGVNSTSAGDRRITRVGRMLRALKLDELPQLWNVLLGEMSLVGPRPQVATDASLYTREEERLFSIRPGITDLASIVFADEGEILAGSADPDLLYNQIVRPWKSRLALIYIDRAYADRVPIALDLRIIWLTFVSAISRQRALAAIERLLSNWNADPLLRRMASRREPLRAWPPPGSDRIPTAYPRAAHA
jgi:lipopolysaccharide/colanic/teichoic acid biosynthesis glycosyltransferase